MNNTYYSSNLTKRVNRGLDLGSRPLGKGSRATTYNNIIRTNLVVVEAHVSAMRFKFKRTTHVHGKDKWFLEDNGSAHSHNLEHFNDFSKLLQRKLGTTPALPTLVEFLIFLITHPTQIHSIGNFVHKKTSSSSNSSSSNSITLPQPSIDTWILDDTPNFDDEEDHLLL